MCVCVAGGWGGVEGDRRSWAGQLVQDSWAGWKVGEGIRITDNPEITCFHLLLNYSQPST